MKDSRSSNKSFTEGCVRCNKDERVYSERDKGAQVPQWRPRGPVCQRISMTQYASNPKKTEWIRGVRERLQGTAAGRGSALCLGTSSATSFSRIKFGDLL